MILGVDHLALSCADVGPVAEELRTLGNAPAFVARGLLNNEAKAPFLRQYAPTHDIAYCTGGGGVALELLRHEAPLERCPSFYQVLFAGTPPPLLPCPDIRVAPWGALFRAAGLARQPTPGWWAGPGTQIWHDEADTAVTFQVRAVLMPVPDLARARRFWEAGVGMQKKDEGPAGGGQRWSQLVLRRPVPPWSLNLVVVEAREETGGTPLLDRTGFPCVALLTNRLEEDRDKLQAEGGHSATAAFAVTVNGKRLRVVLLRGPAQEVVELIEVPSARKG